MVSGYTGGDLKNPTYENHSGHIEGVKITYDSSKVSYRDLVKRIFRRQDPTDSGGSFCDRGHAYRNAFFYANDEEKKIIEEEKVKVEKILGKKVHTLVLSRKFFTDAEGYHQDYYKKNPIRYAAYRWNCGRDQTVDRIWKGK